MSIYDQHNRFRDKPWTPLSLSRLDHNAAVEAADFRARDQRFLAALHRAGVAEGVYGKGRGA